MSYVYIIQSREGLTTSAHYPEIKFDTGDFSEFRCSDNYYDGLIAYYSLVDRIGDILIASREY